MYAAYAAALPTLALGYPLYADSTVRRWVDELEGLPPNLRADRARGMALGAPRGNGRRVIAYMLVNPSERGRSWLVQAGGFGAFIGAKRNAHESQRGVKHGLKHNRVLSLARTADRLVRALVAYPRGIEPAPNPEAEAKKAQRLLVEVAARLLHDGPPRSPSKQRRLAA